MADLSRSWVVPAVVRVAGVLVAAATLALSGPVGPASAHVTVQPGEVEGGGFSVVSFRVPNERDDAATTKIRVTLPDDHPLASVQTTPVPGWTARTTMRTLDEPLDFFGSQVTKVVDEVTWTASGRGIGPGQFLDFELSLGVLPESGDLIFNAFQTYSNGAKVSWNEVAADDSVEPEHPAPVLTLTSQEAERADADAVDGAQGRDDDDSSLLPVGLSVVAVLIALAALGVSLRRRSA